MPPRHLLHDLGSVGLDLHRNVALPEPGVSGDVALDVPADASHEVFREILEIPLGTREHVGLLDDHLEARETRGVDRAAVNARLIGHETIFPATMCQRKKTAVVTGSRGVHWSRIW